MFNDELYDVCMYSEYKNKLKPTINSILCDYIRTE